MQTSSVSARNEMEMPLKNWFENAAKNGTIHTNDWNSEPLLPIPESSVYLPVNKKQRTDSKKNSDEPDLSSSKIDTELELDNPSRHVRFIGTEGSRPRILEKCIIIDQ